MEYPNLFKPIMIGNTLFKNRIFAAPTGHPDASFEGNFAEDVATYYERKAMGGAAAVTLGEAIVDSKYGKRHVFQLSLDTRNSVHSLARVADAIRRHGAVPSIELQHSGMHATPSIYTPGFGEASPIVYGPSECDFNGVHVQEMPEEVIYEVIDKFAESALRCQECGFGMVLIHGGHGRLINEFMSPILNKRTDKWGGSVENRARLAVEICDAIHKKCGRGFPIEFRISSTEAIPGGYTIEDGIEFAKQLEGHANIIHCSVGCGIGLPTRGRTFSITHPCMFKEDGVNVKYAAEIKKQVSGTPIAQWGP